MITNEETIYQSETRGVEKEQNTEARFAPEWKSVAISGVSGILLGAGSMYAIDSLAGNREQAANAPKTEDSNEVNDNASVKVAEVKEGLSFGDAFAQARAEVGPGGVFRWNGGIYGTYTKEEWDNMSAEDKNQYAARVRPEIKANDIVTNESSTSSDNVAEAQSDVHVVSHSASNVHNVSYDEAVVVPSNGSHIDNDPEVRLIGQGPVQLEDGSIVDVAQLKVDDTDVVLIDIDRDSNPDILMADLNNDHQITEGEMYDAHTGNVITEEDIQQATTGNDYYTASDDGSDVASGTPDYMNDADLMSL